MYPAARSEARIPQPYRHLDVSCGRVPRMPPRPTSTLTCQQQCSSPLMFQATHCLTQATPAMCAGLSAFQCMQKSMSPHAHLATIVPRLLHQNTCVATAMQPAGLCAGVQKFTCEKQSRSSSERHAQQLTGITQRAETTKDVFKCADIKRTYPVGLHL